VSNVESRGDQQDGGSGPDDGSADSRADSRPPVAASPAPPAGESDPVRRATLIVLALCVLAFLWYLRAERVTPSTSQARVSGYVVAITPEVSGTVTDVNVELNQAIKKGDLLVQIDPATYQIAVDRAQAELETAGQAMGADTAGVAAAEARVDEARSKLASARRDGKRIDTLYAAGVSSQFRKDRAVSSIDESEAQLAKAKAELQKAKQELGSEGSDNPGLRAALAALRQARIDLDNTTLRAPSDGGVTNVRVDIGQYAKAGQPLMTFLSSTDVWVQAYLRENSLGNVKPGDEAEVVLDIAPGRVFKGVVTSSGFGIKWGSSSQPGELPSVSNSRDWLRDPQRFPVIVHFVGDESLGLRREGGQADVIIYTGDDFLMNSLGKLWIRAMSLFSYVY